MDKNSKPSGKETSTTDPAALPKSKRAISLVNFPLTPAEDAWLRQQKKRVAKVFQQSLKNQEEIKRRNDGND